MKKIIFFITLFSIIIFFGKNLNPYSHSMFIVHDETQPARIQEFALNLKNFVIPPRLAPYFSFRLGYPVFNFYAPASYWITSIFSLVGHDPIASLKFSFLLSMIVGFAGSYFFFREHFDFYPSLTGSILYISSLYYPLDIFVRGNLGEVWFLALFPLALFVLERNAKKPSKLSLFFSVITLSLLFTVHNLLSAVSFVFILIFIFLRPHAKINVFSVILSLLLSSYFLLPLIIENRLTYASYVAAQTKYVDHFVCPYQLWQSPWGFGGSTKGCTDGMSFKIGKIHLILALAGILAFLFNLLKSKKEKITRLALFLLILSAGSLFMTTYFSKPIWDLFSPISALFQFPWRFIAFSLLGLSFFAVYFFHHIKYRFKNIILLFFILLVLINQSRYFYGLSLNKDHFQKKYLSQEYIEKTVAYKIAEYLPKTAEYQSWRNFDNSKQFFQQLNFDYTMPAETGGTRLIIIRNSLFEKEFKINQPAVIYLNIHYFPFWRILINGTPYTPHQFDMLGRPQLVLTQPSSIQVAYRETFAEQLGNYITLLSFFILVYTIRSKKLWNRLVN